MAQVYTADDGTEVEVLNRDGDPSNMHRVNLFLGFLGEGPDMDVFRLLGAGYFHPQLGSVSVSAGFNSVAADLNVFAFRRYKEGVVRNSLTSDMEKVYVAKLPLTKQTNVAPHLAANFFKDPYTQYFQVCPGISIVRNKQLQVETDIRKSRGEQMFRINLDAVLTRSTGNPEELKYTYNNVGVRTYVDGRLGGWSGKGLLSFNYMLGVYYDLNYFQLMAGAGLGINLK